MAEIAWIKITGQEQYKRLARRLKEAGRGDLQRRMTKQIRRTGEPGLRAVQGRFLGVDMTSEGPGGSSSGLRARVAAATRISILGNGIRIRVEEKRVAPNPKHGRTLAHGVNGKPWRHPVWGNRKVWTEQSGQEVFYSTLTGYEAAWRRGIETAMDETAAIIEG